MEWNHSMEKNLPAQHSLYFYVATVSGTLMGTVRVALDMLPFDTDTVYCLQQLLLLVDIA